MKEESIQLQNGGSARSASLRENCILHLALREPIH